MRNHLRLRPIRLVMAALSYRHSAWALCLWGLSSCTNSVGGGEDYERLSGFYILERVDGVLLPAPLPPQQGCSRTVRKTGTFSLSPGRPDLQPMYDWSFVIDADCQPVPSGVFRGAEDVGTWRLQSTELSFRSMMGLGSYGAVLEETTGHPPAITLVHLGSSYRFRRVDDAGGTVFVKVVDQFGQPIEGVFLLFTFKYGLQGGGTTPASGEIGTGGPVGAGTVSITPPAGYEVPPSQPNPFSVSVVEGPPLRLQITLTKIG